MSRFAISSILLAVLLEVIGFWAPFSTRSKFDREEEYVKIRLIAHRLLLESGDSSSPIPNIDQPTPDSYKISFRENFSFTPDTVVQVIGKVLDPRNPDYIVKIIDPNKEATVFGFAILNSQQTELVPCQGRRQSSQPYVVELLFRRKTPVLYNVLKLTGLLLFASSLLFLKKPWKTKTLAEHPPTPSLKETEELDWINLGGFRLHWGNNTLQLQDQVIELTNKEMQLLKMFALEPNTVIDRSRLLKEVWQDEGVMVSRSLDMFISKLRKKLEGDANVQLRNVHGKGYGIFLKELKQGNSIILVT